MRGRGPSCQWPQFSNISLLLNFVFFCHFCSLFFVILKIFPIFKLLGGGSDTYSVIGNELPVELDAGAPGTAMGPCCREPRILNFFFFLSVCVCVFCFSFRNFVSMFYFFLFSIFFFMFLFVCICLFFKLISGTTSLSNWLAEHPRTRWVPPVAGRDNREAHVFDVSPRLAHDTNRTANREKLATVAEPGDMVIDCE